MRPIYDSLVLSVAWGLLGAFTSSTSSSFVCGVACYIYMVEFERERTKL